jgi:predicted transposase YbfD/YdcC
MAHLVSAYVDANRTVFAQAAVADRCNELEAVPRLLGLLSQWPGLSAGSMGVVEAVRQDLGDPSGKVTTERRYFISSRGGTDAARLAEAVRGYWSVENRLHGQLDVSFREDERRIRKGHGAENYSRLCRLALNPLTRDRSVQIGVHGKRLKAGWDEHYLLRLLTG